MRDHHDGHAVESIFYDDVPADGGEGDRRHRARGANAVSRGDRRRDSSPRTARGRRCVGRHRGGVRRIARKRSAPAGWSSIASKRPCRSGRESAGRTARSGWDGRGSVDGGSRSASCRERAGRARRSVRSAAAAPSRGRARSCRMPGSFRGASPRRATPPSRAPPVTARCSTPCASPPSGRHSKRPASGSVRRSPMRSANAVRLLAASVAFRDLVAEAPLDLAKLVWTSRWITPAGIPKRFDTYFFLAAVSRDAVATARAERDRRSGLASSHRGAGETCRAARCRWSSRRCATSRRSPHSKTAPRCSNRGAVRSSKRVEPILGNGKPALR